MAVTRSKSAKKVRGKPPARKNTKSKKSGSKWSADVMKHSNALDLEQHIFESHDPKYIAESLKHSAEKSRRKKGTSYQSAMSMLSFYINRAGKNLEPKQKQVLEKVKEELRHVFGRG